MQSKTTLENLASAGKIIPTLINGACPYPCTDTRCKAYANGYCGGTTDTIAVIKNPNNPDDYVGLQHNNGCSVLLNELNSSSPTIYSDILHFTKLYLKSNSYDTTSFNNSYNYAVTHGYYILPDTFYTSNPDSLTIKLYNNGLISITAKNYINSINGVINNTIADNDPTSALYNSMASQLITIENAVFANTNLTSNEKQSLLIMSSVARYSGEYWSNYILSNSGSSSTTQKLFAKGWFKSFLHADAGGAIAGGIAGAFAGGIVVGALGGGLGASVANLFGF